MRQSSPTFCGRAYSSSHFGEGPFFSPPLARGGRGGNAAASPWFGYPLALSIPHHPFCLHGLEDPETPPTPPGQGGRKAGWRRPSRVVISREGGLRGRTTFVCRNSAFVGVFSSQCFLASTFSSAMAAMRMSMTNRGCCPPSTVNSSILTLRSEKLLASVEASARRVLTQKVRVYPLDDSSGLRLDARLSSAPSSETIEAQEVTFRGFDSRLPIRDPRLNLWALPSGSVRA